ncbi:hypothetical protein AK812_SmicGene48865, partial [Symbiodinium microadriaticum]
DRPCSLTVLQQRSSNGSAWPRNASSNFKGRSVKSRQERLRRCGLRLRIALHFAKEPVVAL